MRSFTARCCWVLSTATSLLWSAASWAMIEKRPRCFEIIATPRSSEGFLQAPPDIELRMAQIPR